MITTFIILFIIEVKRKAPSLQLYYNFTTITTWDNIKIVHEYPDSKLREESKEEYKKCHLARLQSQEVKTRLKDMERFFFETSIR